MKMREKRKLRRGNAHFKTFSATFLIVVGILILQISMVSAWEFDNIKDSTTITFDRKDIKDYPLLQEYSPIKISNAFNLPLIGDTIFEGYLSQHTETCGIDCSSTMEIKLYEERPLIDEVEFKTLQLDGKWIEQNVRNYQFKYLGIKGVYETQCTKGIEKIYPNGTKYIFQECSEVYMGPKESWINYELGTIMPEGIYTIKLEAQKKPSRTIDWIIKTGGKTLTEWATWGNISEGDDAEVILNSPADEYTFLTNLQTFNCSAEVTGGASLINISLWTNETGTWDNKNSTIAGGGTTNLTKAHGVSITSDTVSNNPFGLRFRYDGDTTYNITSVKAVAGAGCDYTNLAFENGTKLSMSGQSSQAQGGVMVFNNNVTLQPGEIYRIECATPDNDRKYATGSFPVTADDMTWLGGSYNYGTNDTSWNNIESINITVAFVYSSTGTWNRTLNSTTLWSCQGCDSDGDCGFATENRTLFLDTTIPTISLESPIGTLDYGTIGQNEILNVTFTDTNLDSCWYNYNGTNITINGCLTGIKNSTTFILEPGNTNIIIYVNDSVGNKNSTTSSWIYDLTENSQTYNSSTYESSIEDFEINLTYDSSEWLDISATLYYNETGYEGDEVGSGDDLTFNTSVTIPSIDSDTNITFYWTITLTNSTDTYYYNSTFYNQTILTIPAFEITDGSCSAGFFPTINYTFADERNLTSLNANVKYNFKYGIGVLTSNIISGKFTNASSFAICINQTIDSYKLGYGEIEYNFEGYVSRRYYMFEGQSLSNSTTNNITIYHLESGKATSFLFEVKNTFLNPYVNKLIGLLRWYPQEDEYKVVELSKTDQEGKALMKVEVEDVDYRIGVYNLNGILIKLAEPVRMACLIEPCTYSLKIISEEKEYFDIYGIESSLTFDEDHNRFVYIWNDPSQSTKSMRLIVVKESGYQKIIICNSTGSGYTGVLTCNVGDYTGLLTAKAFRTASPETILALLSRTIGTVLNNTFGLFAAWMIMLIAAFAGVWSPVAAIVLSIPGLILAVIFGSINFTIFMGIVVLAGLIIHMIKKTK